VVGVELEADHLVRHDGSAHLRQLVRGRITGTVAGVEVEEDDGGLKPTDPGVRKQREVERIT
jgi:hypothetical protein